MKAAYDQELSLPRNLNVVGTEVLSNLKNPTITSITGEIDVHAYKQEHLILTGSVSGQGVVVDTDDVKLSLVISRDVNLRFPNGSCIKTKTIKTNDSNETQIPLGNHANLKLNVKDTKSVDLNLSYNFSADILWEDTYIASNILSMLEQGYIEWEITKDNFSKLEIPSELFDNGDIQSLRDYVHNNDQLHWLYTILGKKLS